MEKISKINLDFSVYNVFECHYTNELICNDKTIDWKTFTIKRELEIYSEGSDILPGEGRA